MYSSEHKLMSFKGDVFACLRTIAFIAMMVLSLPSSARSERQAVFPCLDFQAIRWVRDATYCDQYYICHFGQPMSMPACPSGQVWSNLALNCVPENSRWDDCNTGAIASPPLESLDIPESSQTVKYDTQERTNIELPPTQRTGGNSIVVVKQLSTQATRAEKRNLPVIQAKMVKSAPVFQKSSAQKLGQVNLKLTTASPVFYTNSPRSWVDGKGQRKPATQDRRNGQPNTPERRNGQLSTQDRRNGQQMRWYTEQPRLNLTQRVTTAPTVTSRASTAPPVTSQDLRRTSRPQPRQETTAVPHTLESKLRLLDIDTDHPCIRQPGALLPHPENCHWYINCSLANLDDTQARSNEEQGDDPSEDTREGFYLLQPFRVRREGVFVWECRFPQLFDDVTNVCREFINVECKNRFEPVDQCEYSARQQCQGQRCLPCEKRFGKCRGRENGVYPVHQDKWTPLFVTCYLQRNIALDECIPPTPIFSPEALDCVSLFEVPKVHGGFLPDCSSRPDGYYPDEQGRCAIFFRCALGTFRGYDECPPGSVFDPAVPSCQPFSLASRPCGEGQAPLCGGKLDGHYADPYGRCTHYFECKQGAFQQYNTCDLGIFDPLTQKCVLSAELTVRPCGLQPSPCETLPTGVYPDQATGCSNFIECQKGVMLTNGTCARGTVFSAITGRCDLPENAPPPCGFSDTCRGKTDGRYPALTRGCSFFYECYHGEFISLRRCTASDGGFFFNPATGDCDYPQNICPPCGYKWWGCDGTYQV